MAIVVATAQWVTARQQLELAGLQARIARAGALPNFDISIQQTPDANGYYGNYIMILSNSGGPVHELTADPLFLLHAETSLPNSHGAVVAADLPINGYYFVHFVSGASRGEVARFWGKDNAAKARALEVSAVATSKAKHWTDLVFGEQSYVRLSYRDLTGDKHTDYYQVDAVGGGKQLSNDAGAAIFKRRTYPIPDLDKLDARQLLHRIELEAS